MITISFLSVKYTKKHISTPLIKLKSIIEELSLGKVIDVPHSKNHDEVAEMKQSLQKHIEGIKEKINFTKNISKHNTRQNLVLTSSEDVLGNSLSKMAETINEKSNEITKLNKLQEAIFNSTDQAIISTDLVGTIISFNRAAEEMLGYKAKEMVNKELGQNVEPGFEVFTTKTIKNGKDQRN